MNSNASSLFSRTREAVLQLFFCNPDESFYLREVARRSGCALGAVQRELAQLVAAGVLTREADGRQVYFTANRACPIFPELQGIIIKTAGLAGALRKALATIHGARFAFIYGSFARGEQRAESDVDLMLIGDVSLPTIISAIRPAAQQIGREVNPSIYPLAEFRSKLKAGHHFLSTVMREPKLMLIGQEHELAAMARQWLAHSPHEQSGRNPRPARTGRSRSGRLSGRAPQR